MIYTLYRSFGAQDYVYNPLPVILLHGLQGEGGRMRRQAASQSR